MIIEEKYNIEKHFLIVDSIEVYPEEESLKDYLLIEAHLDINNYLAQTYLLFDVQNNEKTLIGYYTLRTFGFAIKDSSDSRLHYYPCVELSQLLVDINHRNKGAGRIMINSVLTKASDISNIAGCKLLVAFSLDDKSTSFYKNVGFKNYEPYDNDKKALLLSETCYHDGLPILGIEIN